MKIENYYPEEIHINIYPSIEAYGNSFLKSNNSKKSV